MNYKAIKLLLILCSAATVASTCASLATSSSQIETVGQLLCAIKQYSFQGVYKLIFMFSYVSGFAVIGNAIFKLKQVKDNPTQIPVSTPIALFVCGTLLMMLPSVIKPIGETLFGSIPSSLESGYSISGSNEITDNTTGAGSVIPPNLLDTS